MATFTVTTTADRLDAGDGVLSLRETVRLANGTAAADRIVFAGALEGRTLVLAQGQLDLTADVTIDGDRDDDGTKVTLDADRASRVFAVAGTGTDARLTGLGVTGGYVVEEGGGGILLGAGSALALSGCTVSGNRAGDTPDLLEGGGVLAEVGSRLIVDRSELADNLASNGGAIAAVGAADVRLSRSVVSDNGRVGEFGSGGGLYLSGVDGAEIERCAITGNGAISGAGIFIRGGSASVRESTVAGNTTSGEFPTVGAGIFAYGGGLVLLNSTVTGNIANNSFSGYGAGIDVRDSGSGRGSLAVANSIVAGNLAILPDGERLADDVAGRVAASNGHNVFGTAVDGNVPGDLENVSAGRLFAALDPDSGGGRLALNGGPTPTVRLRDALNNPAVSGAEPRDAGDLDQRGADRPLPSDTNPDIGALELDQRQVSRGPSANNDALTGTPGAETLEALAGNDLVRGLGGNDLLLGLAGSDTLDGGFGGDALNGGTASDLLRGGDGRDLLRGGPHRDALLGGVGADRFDVEPGDSGVGAARRDLVLDFARGTDRVDLASIDAVAGGADNAFAFIGRAAFSAPGQLRFVQTGGETVVQGSTDADPAPELEIAFAGARVLGSGDFVL